jgi:hypothetical protein
MLEGCHFFGATPLAPSHSNAATRTLRQQLRRKQNKSHRQMHKNAGGEQIDAKQCLTDLAASTLQTTGRQLMRMMSGGKKDKQGQFGSNATEFGAGLGLPRLTGDGADDGTSNDAGVRGATGRAG